MKIFSNYRFLILITIVAALIRFWQLGNIPPSLDWDEAALGYNAYSILKTGRDEYGTRFPLVLRSYDDYKPPLYVYLAIPSIYLFGLEPWAVRLPSAVIGTLGVVGTYFLVKALLHLLNHQPTDDWKHVPGIAALLLALSPWHIQFSRIAFEANVGVAINIWAAVFFLEGLRNVKKLGISAFLFGLSLYAYHSERIFVPILVFLLSMFFFKDLWKQKRNVMLAVLIGIITVLPLIPVFFNNTTLTRLQGTSSLADQTQLLAISVKKLDYDKANGVFWGVIFDNRRIVWLQTVATGYLSHYSFRWLFLTGDNARHHAPDMGLLYLWELPFLLWGMFSIGKRGGTMSKIVWSWFLIAPIAASPTTELPHAIRTLVFLPTFQIFTAVGVARFIYTIKKSKILLSKILTVIVALVIIFNTVLYLHMYFGHMNHEFSKSWQYGYRQAVDYTKTYGNKYQKIIVSTKLEQPYMFFLFFLKYDPIKYLEHGGTRSGGFAEDKNDFDKYQFRPIDWNKEIKDGSVLYIGKPSEIPSSNILKTIHYLDGDPAMSIANH